MAVVFAGVIPASLSLMPLLLAAQAAFVHKSRLRHRGAVAAFALVVWAMFALCGVPGFTVTAGDADVNWIPLADLPGNAAGLFQNVLLFVPLGMLLPLLWREFGDLWRAVLFGLCLSLFIECSQLLNFRVTDVDDLITNTLGTVLGGLLVRALPRAAREALTADDPEACGTAEAVLAVLLAFLYTFFLAPVFG